MSTHHDHGASCAHAAYASIRRRCPRPLDIEYYESIIKPLSLLLPTIQELGQLTGNNDRLLRSTGIIEVSVEEFVPIEQVDVMLDIIKRAEGLSNVNTSQYAEDLKRAMVWMEKYIAPTAEFWNWKEETYSLDDSRTSLRVSFIALGWVIAVTREYDASTTVDPAAEEALLCKHLDKLMAGVPTGALARISSKTWDKKHVVQVSKYLKGQNIAHRIVDSHTALQFEGDYAGIRIKLDGDWEYVTCPSCSVQTDHRVIQLLKKIKDYENKDGKWQGADWCCFTRRRLTLVHRKFNRGQHKPTEVDFKFTDATDLQTRRWSDQYDLVCEVGDNKDCEDPLATLLFPQYAYHRGIGHTRATIGTQCDIENDTYVELRKLVSYLWVNHYRRIYRYLQFENHFAYSATLRHTSGLNDMAVERYSSRVIALEELRAGIEYLIRVENGELNAYAPSRRFSFQNVTQGEESNESRLRTNLILSDITELTEDPLKGAPVVVDHVLGELLRTHSAYAQNASLRMQRSLQFLQFLFVFAAAVQLLVLLPIAEIFDAWVSPLVQSEAATQLRDGWFPRGIDLSLLAVRATLLTAISLIAVGAIRIKRARRVLDRILG